MGEGGTSLTATVTIDAFHALYRHHHGFVWATLRRFGVDGSATDDAVQDTFVIAYRRFADFRGESPKPWLYGIARRVASNHRRKRATRTRGQQGLAEMRHSFDATPNTPRWEALLAIDRAVEGLSQIDRELFFLSELDGLTAPELADALSLKPNTVYWRIRRLRMHLADIMGEGPVPGKALEQRRPAATHHGWIALVAHLEVPAKSAFLPWFGGMGQLVGSRATMIVASVLASGTAGIIVALAHTNSPTRVAVSENPPRPLPVSNPPTAPRSTQNPAAIPPLASTSPAPAPPEFAPISTPDETSTSASSRLGSWNVRLNQAMLALHQGDPERALELTRSPAVRVPDPVDDLRIVLRIEALCALDRQDEAADAGRAFSTRRPHSILGDRLERTCARPTTESSNPRQVKE